MLRPFRETCQEHFHRDGRCLHEGKLPCRRAARESQCQVDLSVLSLLWLLSLQVSQGRPVGRGCQAHLFVRVNLVIQTSKFECDATDTEQSQNTNHCARGRVNGTARGPRASHIRTPWEVVPPPFKGHRCIKRERKHNFTNN